MPVAILQPFVLIKMAKRSVCPSIENEPEDTISRFVLWAQAYCDALTECTAFSTAVKKSFMRRGGTSLFFRSLTVDILKQRTSSLKEGTPATIQELQLANSSTDSLPSVFTIPPPYTKIKYPVYISQEAADFFKIDRKMAVYVKKKAGLENLQEISDPLFF